MSDEPGAGVAHRYAELKRLLLQYTSFSSDLPVLAGRAADLGPPFEKCLLEARFVFPGLTSEEQEQIALVRLAGVNILGRHLMTRLSSEGLERCGLRIDDKQELNRVTEELEADFLECKQRLLDQGITKRLTAIQRLFWNEWSNPFHGQSENPADPGQ